MTRIVLTRHGHVEGISPPRFRGRVELDLTPLGEAQARATAAFIAAHWRAEAIYASPLKRCRQTAAIASACGVPVSTLADLNDIDYGALNGASFEDARRKHPALFATWFEAPHRVRFPNGESLAGVVERAAAAVRLACERHPGGTVVMVGHDTLNRALLLPLLEQPLQAFWRLAQSPCGVTEIEIAANRVEVLRVNETGHLPSPDAPVPATS